MKQLSLFFIVVVAAHQAIIDGISSECFSRSDTCEKENHSSQISLKDSQKIFGQTTRLSNRSHQCLVHVKQDRRKYVHSRLVELCGFVHYIPQNTFLIILPEQAIQDVKKLDGVHNIEMVPSAMKIGSKLSERIHSLKKVVSRTIGRPAGYPECEPVPLDILTAQNIDAEEHEISSLCNLEACATAKMVSDGKWFLETDSCHLSSLVSKLVSHQSVLWIQERTTLKLHNKYTTRMVQSTHGDRRLLWEKGLTGDGEVIGVTDTGVDYESCFFSDPHIPLPVCMGTGAVDDANCINHKHRKIVTYRYFPNTEIGDARDGHGTSVCGSALGSILNETENPDAVDYSGIAKNAKLAFDDISADGDALLAPPDFNTLLLPHPYKAGARTHSFSWGNGNSEYDELAMQIDTFMYEHDDFLVVAAAGNDGPRQQTVGSPATAKNVLSVGASENSLLALAEYGDLNIAVQVLANVSEFAYESFTLQGAEFGPPIVDESGGWTSNLLAADPLQACNALNTESLAGKIALIRRGQCSFGSKVLNAQQAGAIAVLIYNNVSNEDLVLMTSQENENSIRIPSAFLAKEDGEALLAMLASQQQQFGRFKPLRVGIIVQSGTPLSVLASLSSRGPTSDGRIKPDVVCPGLHVRSAKAAQPGNILACNKDSIAEKSGTSMSAPLCAGTAALVRQYFREGFHVRGHRDRSHGINASSALIKAIMVHSGRPFLKAGSRRRVGSFFPNMAQGYGRVDLTSTLWFGNESGFDMNVWNRETIANGETKFFCVDVLSDSVPFRVSLVWTDPPALPSASKILVNNLDLIVVDPLGKFFYGNAQTQWNEAHGMYPVIDVLNNVEQVTVSNPSIGSYVVKVVGADVPVEPQNFAMVVTGNFSVNPACEVQSACPSDCSGHGTCKGETCECFITYSGIDCSLPNVILRSGTPYQISLSPQGWAYYILQFPRPDSVWSLDLEVQQGAPNFFLAFNRTPSQFDYDISDTSTGPTVKLDCLLPCLAKSLPDLEGAWVLGVTSSCCQAVTVIADLTSNVACPGGYLGQDFSCKNCTTSQCPIGQYRDPCTYKGDGICQNCTVAPENASYTGAGYPSHQNNCPWKCNPGMFSNGTWCIPCSRSACSTGQYRGPCTEMSDGVCVMCSGKDANAVYVSSGIPFDRDNCSWVCQQNFSRFNNTCQCIASGCAISSSAVTFLPFPAQIPTKGLVAQPLTSISSLYHDISIGTNISQISNTSNATWSNSSNSTLFETAAAFNRTAPPKQRSKRI